MCFYSFYNRIITFFYVKTHQCGSIFILCLSIIFLLGCQSQQNSKTPSDIKSSLQFDLLQKKIEDSIARQDKVIEQLDQFKLLHSTLLLNIEEARSSLSQIQTQQAEASIRTFSSNEKLTALLSSQHELMNKVSSQQTFFYQLTKTINSYHKVTEEHRQADFSFKPLINPMPVLLFSCSHPYCIPEIETGIEKSITLLPLEVVKENK